MLTCPAKGMILGKLVQCFSGSEASVETTTK